MTEDELPPESLEDENRAVLEQLAADGIDMTRSRDVEFVLVFPDQEHATAAASAVAAAGFGTELREPDAEDLEDGFTDWEVIATRGMVPTVESVTAAERELGDLAAQHGGETDGWGFLREADEAGEAEGVDEAEDELD